MAGRIILPDIGLGELTMHSQLPLHLYNAASVRALDAQIIAAGIPGIELMQRAAAAVWRELRRRWPQARSILILCGGGNNGGDGYLVARLALQAGWDVRLLALVAPDKLTGDAAQACLMAAEAGVVAESWAGELPDADVIVDALLGTGLQQNVREPYRALIKQLNQQPAPIIAVDLPSGLNADRGCVEGVAVAADVTVTFIALKPGLFTGQGPDLVGELEFAPLVAKVPSSVPPQLERLSLSSAVGLPPRPLASHKGNFGHLLIIGGNNGMGGAALLAAETALRCGAGKVTVASRSMHLPGFLARCPEVMAHGVDDPAQLAPLLEQATAVVLGPGLGKDQWAEDLLQSVLESGLPRILDADGLNLIASAAQALWLGPTSVITPHPAEAARLLGVETAAVQVDRVGAVTALAERFACVAVLKGVGSLVAGPSIERLPSLCSDGNPGMASAGMGDVLSGLVGALLAQGMAASDAARYAVLLHALAGDRAAEQAGQVGLLASDLISFIRFYLNQRNI